MNVSVLVFYVLGLDFCIVPGESIFESPKVIWGHTKWGYIP
jgi:hypothetical protein